MDQATELLSHPAVVTVLGLVGAYVGRKLPGVKQTLLGVSKITGGAGRLLVKVSDTLKASLG